MSDVRTVFSIQKALGINDLTVVKDMFKEYAMSLDIDLGFQQFGKELTDLPGEYAAPTGGLWLARVHDEVVGCVAVRKLEGKICEMKRLYVRPSARGVGIGRALAETAVNFAQVRGYQAIRLDTLPTMTNAQELYRQMGFVEVSAYRFNPVEGTVYMERRFDSK